jgi:hypothetical protein
MYEKIMATGYQKCKIKIRKSIVRKISDSLEARVGK